MGVPEDEIPHEAMAREENKIDVEGMEEAE